MNKKYEDGVLDAVLLKILHESIPHALSIEEKLKGGNSLDDFDMVFLRTAVVDTRNYKPLVDRHEEYQGLMAQLMQLYTTIIQLGLANERPAQ